MRRIFTVSILTAALVAASFNSFAQTCTGGAFTAAETYDFANSANGTMGFTGNFSRVNPGVLQSTNVGPTSPTTKVLTSPSFLAPNSITNIQFGFDVAGNADVTGYTVEFLYDCPSGICAVTVCSAPATTLNGTVNFSVAAPAQIIGQRFAIRITYTVSGTTNQNITIDNFRTNVGASAIVLPVKFAGFEAKNVSSGINLIWNVGAEENVGVYEITKSTDGRSYETIGQVDASGETVYSFVDTKASEATAYYRIKAVDIDGKLTFSPIVTVKGGKAGITLKAFPMPAINEITLQHATASNDSRISISTAEGRAVKAVVPARGAQQTTISLSSLQPGVYMIRYSDGNGIIETLKIVKQ